MLIPEARKRLAHQQKETIMTSTDSKNVADTIQSVMDEIKQAEFGAELVCFYSSVL